MLTGMTLDISACLCSRDKQEGTAVSMATAKAQYIIARYSSQAGTFGQK